MRVLSGILCLLALLFVTGCEDSGGEAAGSLKSLKIRVDFDSADAPAAKLAARATQSTMTALTPTAYDVKICRLVLWNPSQDERFEVFAYADSSLCPVFRFTEGQAVAESMLPAGATLPDEPGFTVAEMDIVYMEMALAFHIQATGQHETRRLRLYMTTDAPYFPGDIRVLRDGGFGDYWGFGPGNVTNDPMLMGLPRSEAYSIPTWPRSHSTAEWGPFGDALFWENNPPNPFTWAVALPLDGEDDRSAVIVFKVAQTWHFTDQNADGIYDWPGDYGNLWHMEFPTIVGVVEP